MRARVAEAEQAVIFPLLLLVALSTRDLFIYVLYSNHVFFAAQIRASAPKCAVHHREEPGAVAHLYIILSVSHKLLQSKE
jgi:hypothetical protein